MKKILFIASFPPPVHGGNVDNYHIAEYWNSSKVSLLTFNISRKNRKSTTIGRFSIANFFYALYHSSKLFFYLLMHRPIDAIFMNLAQGNVGFIRDSMFIMVGKLFRLKIICRFPGGDFEKYYQHSGIKCFVKSILKKVDLIITEGATIIDQFRNINPQGAVQDAFLGIPDHYTKNGLLEKKQFVVLYLCNHRKEKGFWDVFFSIKSIIKENDNIFFNFAGELLLSKKEMNFIDEYIKNEKLDNYLDFPGQLLGDDKWNAFRNASIQILPSYSEGLPTAIVEGLSFGLPIVASRVGVIPEIIKHEINGYLINAGDTCELKRIIVDLSKSPELVEKMSECNRKLFLENFTISKFNSNLEQIFNNHL